MRWVIFDCVKEMDKCLCADINGNGVDTCVTIRNIPNYATFETLKKLAEQHYKPQKKEGY